MVTTTGMFMESDFLLAGVVAAGLFCYLIYSLLYPQKF
jgi:K+-transporting ATPase KdpF subunit